MYSDLDLNWYIVFDLSTIVVFKDTNQSSAVFYNDLLFFFS
jgi:hypothetical protein